MSIDYSNYDVQFDGSQWDDAVNKLNRRDRRIIGLISSPIREELEENDIYLAMYVQPIDKIGETSWGDFGTDSLSDEGYEGDYIIFEIRFSQEDQRFVPLSYQLIHMHHQLNDHNKRVADQIFRHYLRDSYDWDMSDSRTIIIK